MASWRVPAFVSFSLALAAAAACSSFETASDDGRTDGGTEASTVDAPAGPVADAAAADGGGGADAGAKRIWVYGGYSNNSASELSKAAFSAEILPDGALGAWMPAPDLDTSRYFAANAVTSTGRVVFASGSSVIDDAGVPKTNSVETASLAPLGKFSTNATLATAIYSATGATDGRWVFVLGGQSDDQTPRSEVYRSSFDTNGALLPWELASHMPAGATNLGGVVLGDTLYIAGGGYFMAGGGLQKTLDSSRATIASDGKLGVWMPNANLPQPVWANRLVAANGRLYSLGGRLASDEPTDAVVVGTIEAQGGVTWATANPMPSPRVVPCALVANGVIYVTGGFGASEVPDTTVYVGRIGASGGIVWSPTSELPGPRAAHGCAAF